MSEVPAQIAESRNKAIQCFTIGKVFRKRAEKYALFSERLTMVGIAVPSMVGVTILSFGLGQQWYSAMIPVAACILIVQFFYSIVAVVQNWTGKLQYSVEAANVNFELSNGFNNLALSARNPPPNYEITYAELCARDTLQESKDEQQSISPKERHRGYREALLKFQEPCPTCKAIPKSIIRTNCESCGDI